MKSTVNRAHMKRKLVFDPAFQPVRYTGENKEKEFFCNGMFHFDIAALNEHIRTHQEDYVLIDIEVDRYYSEVSFMNAKESVESLLQGASKKDSKKGHGKPKEEHIEAADVSRPIIFAEIIPDRLDIVGGINPDNLTMRGYSLIDGHHRIVKAHRLGHTTLKAYLVRMEQHLPFMFAGYKEYVEYWNEKLKGY